MVRQHWEGTIETETMLTGIVARWMIIVCLKLLSVKCSPSMVLNDGGYRPCVKLHLQSMGISDGHRQEIGNYGRRLYRWPQWPPPSNLGKECDLCSVWTVTDLLESATEPATSVLQKENCLLRFSSPQCQRCKYWFLSKGGSCTGH